MNLCGPTWGWASAHRELRAREDSVLGLFASSTRDAVVGSRACRFDLRPYDVTRPTWGARWHVGLARGDRELGVVERDHVARRFGHGLALEVGPRTVRDHLAADDDIEVLPLALPRAGPRAGARRELGLHVGARDVV